jgi:hypothetical protein
LSFLLYPLSGCFFLLLGLVFELDPQRGEYRTTSKTSPVSCLTLFLDCSQLPYCTSELHCCGPLLGNHPDQSTVVMHLLTISSTLSTLDGRTKSNQYVSKTVTQGLYQGRRFHVHHLTAFLESWLTQRQVVRAFMKDSGLEPRYVPCSEPGRSISRSIAREAPRQLEAERRCYIS